MFNHLPGQFSSSNSSTRVKRYQLTNMELVADLSATSPASASSSWSKDLTDGVGPSTVV